MPLVGCHCQMCCWDRETGEANTPAGSANIQSVERRQELDPEYLPDSNVDTPAPRARVIVNDRYVGSGATPVATTTVIPRVRNRGVENVPASAPLRSHRARQTGAMIEQRQLTSGTGYLVHCLAHDSWWRTPLSRNAAYYASRPATWCNECAVLVRDGRRVETPAETTRREAREASERAEAARPRRHVRTRTRRFGVEIECRSSTSSWGALEAALNDAGLGQWEVKDDPSIYGGGSVELVSPPLKGDDGAEQVTKACAILAKLKFKVNNSCGLHVHIDAGAIAVDPIKRFVQSWFHNHDLIDFLVAPSRRRNQYSRRLSASDLNFIMDKTTKNAMSYSGYRYRSVNVSSLGTHGTVEIRQHQGTIDASKILAWVEFIQAFMDACVTSRTALDKHTDGLKGLMERLKVEENARAYLIGRAVAFDADAEILLGAKA